MITLHEGDLPKDVLTTGDIAIDTETMGLSSVRDRLCLVQLSNGDGTAHLVRFERGVYNAPNLRALLADKTRQKIFHFGRFDVMMVEKYLGVTLENVFCTKIASRLCRTYTDRHSLKDLVRELLGVEMDKQAQTSDWGAPTLTETQMKYAASDVLYLHRLRDDLITMLKREDRLPLAQACFDFLPHRAKLDLGGWENLDIFAH